jgi:CO/xanthine dehydrogenase FAD-binding subunit
MFNRPREFYRPLTVAEAVRLLRRPAARALMPGPRLPDEPFAGIEAAVDLSALPLNYLRAAEGRIHIGALTPLQTVADSALLTDSGAGLLVRAALLAAGSALRHLATLGGAASAPQGPPEVVLALLALEAVVVVHGAARREVPLAEYFPEPAELMEEVSFAPRPGMRTGLERVARTPRDEAMVAVVVAMTVDGGVCRWVRLAAGGVGPRPGLVRSVENVLVGERVTLARVAEAAEAVEAVVNPANDFRASAEYRRAMARVLAQRALRQAGQI